ncbi:M15 family metallopeptidase [Jeotgalibaca sp. A122]|uniref:M15 family metallopeptidase n=1 Tax=Jeotgalibaca sp. A122 TaxID=3457322 RepID=UPI003FD10217
MMNNNSKNKKILATLALSGFTIFSLSACGLVSNTPDKQESSSEIISQLESHSESLPGSQVTESSENPKASEIEALESKLVKTPDVHSSDWNLILVNQANQLTEDLDFEPYTASSGEVMDARVAEDFERMIADGEAQGLQFIFESGYRSYAYQEQIYNNVYNGHINNGYSEADAQAMTEDFIAVPGTSEHMTGLALDITEPSIHHLENGLITEFENTQEGQWLHQNASDYGFILRYPRGKEGIIDVNYESWHFRYVGQENAQYITENDLALEEYIAILKNNEAIRQQISELSE